MEYLIISVEEQQVAVARFGLTGRSAVLAGAASFARDETMPLEAIAARIAEGISGSPRVVLCLPPALFAQRAVDLPLKDLRKVREILKSQLQGEIALAAEEAVFDVLPSGEGRFLALWARQNDIAGFITLFQAAGCEPQVVSALPFAWQLLPGIDANCAVCDGSALAVIREGRITFMRSLEAAEPEKQVAVTLSALEMSGAELPGVLYVYGERLEELAAAGGIPLPVRHLELPPESATLFRTDSAFQQLAGLYAAARACHEGSLPDFRRGGLAWTAGSVKLRRQLYLTSLLAALAIILLFVSKGLQYQAARADIDSLNKSIAAIYREIFPTRAKAVDELSEVKGEIRKLSGVENSSAVLESLRQLSEAKGTAINGLYEAEVEGRNLRIKGDARSAQAVNEFKAALNGLMSAVEMGEIKSRPDGTVSFSLSGTLKEVGK